MRTSSACRLNRFQPAASSARSRSASVVSRIGSTAWMRKGSMIVCQRSMPRGYAARVRRAGCPPALRPPGVVIRTRARCGTSSSGLMGSGKTTVGRFGAAARLAAARLRCSDRAPGGTHRAGARARSAGPRCTTWRRATCWSRWPARSRPSSAPRRARSTRRRALRALDGPSLVWLTASPATGAARFDGRTHRPRYGATIPDVPRGAGARIGPAVPLRDQAVLGRIGPVARASSRDLVLAGRRGRPSPTPRRRDLAGAKPGTRPG